MTSIKNRKGEHMKEKSSLKKKLEKNEKTINKERIKNQSLHEYLLVLCIVHILLLIYILLVLCLWLYTSNIDWMTGNGR